MYKYKEPPTNIAVGDLVKKKYPSNFFNGENHHGVGVVTSITHDPDYVEVEIFFNYVTFSPKRGIYGYVPLDGNIEILAKAK